MIVQCMLLSYVVGSINYIVGNAKFFTWLVKMYGYFMHGVHLSLSLLYIMYIYLHQVSGDGVCEETN